MNDHLVRAPLEGQETIDFVRTLSSVSSSHGNAEDKSFQNLENHLDACVPGRRRSPRDGGKGGTKMPTASAVAEANAASLPSAPTPSSSWEAPACGADENQAPQSMSVVMPRQPPGQEPPVLEDEDEEEMVSLEQQRILLQERQRQMAAAAGAGSAGHEGLTTHLRRTPGANAMHRSAFLRRTPGASTMHRSAGDALEGGGGAGSVGECAGAPADPAPVLGFGLTLTTPVGQGPRGGTEKEGGNGGGEAAGTKGCVGHSVTLSYTSSGSSDDVTSVPPAASGSAECSRGSEHRPPLDPNISRQNYVYTPAGLSLAKNPHLNMERGAGMRDAFSPNTIRLTESLDHLLYEEEEDLEINAKKKGGVVGSKQPATTLSSLAEDWSEAYTFDQESGNNLSSTQKHKLGGKKSPSAASRKGRKNRSSPRGSPRTHDAIGADGQPLQPRAQHPAKPPNRLSGGSPDRPFPCGDGADVDERPGPLNFDPSGGGAFAPPSKSNAAYQPQPGTSFHTPTPKKPQGGTDQSRGGGHGHGQYQPVAQGDIVSPQQLARPAPHQYNNGVGLHLGQHRANDPYFVPQQHMPDQSASGFAQQHQHQHHLVHGHFSDRSFAPSPHHFDYMPHPYGSHPPGMVSPVGVPPVSPMTVPSYPMEHHPHAHTAGHPTSHLPHVMAPQPFSGMGLPHTQPPPPPQMSGPPSWSPPPLPPYVGGQRNNGWQQQHGSGADAGGGWSAPPLGPADYGYGASLPPPPPPPMGHMSPPPQPASPFTVPSWLDYGGGMGLVEPHASAAYPSSGHYPIEEPGFPPRQAPHGGRAVQQQFDGNRNNGIVQSGPGDRGAESYYPLQQSNSAQVGRKQMQQQVEESCGSKQSQAKEKAPRGKQSKQIASRKQRSDNSMCGQQNQKSPPNKAKMNGAIEEADDSPKQRRAEKSEKKMALESPKKKRPSQLSGDAPTQLTKKEGRTEGIAHAPDQDAATEMKKAELNESPGTRAAFKDFYRKFRVKERSSFQEAEEFASRCLADESVLPRQVHWRVHLELADLAKRSNRFDEARRLYRQVCTLQPFASQGWLEYSKLEEESGELDQCARLLREGLSYCEYNESLLTRALKHEERAGNLKRARQLLARLKHVGIEKVWRTVLEGALLEARAGNVDMARRVLKYLMHHVPWYGPLFFEAYRLERNADRPADALAIVERGLGEIPRYGPLWFGAFQLCEGLDIDAGDLDLPRTKRMLSRAIENISRELLWKVHLEGAQAQERAALLTVEKNPELCINQELVESRRSFAKAVLACPPSLCWKVWLAGGRMELSAGQTEKARKLFLRAHEVVPEKGRGAVLLECARLEAFAGDLELARAILCRARNDVGSDWKVWLECISLEVRDKRRGRAISLARRALTVHGGTGRLWAALVQLRQPDGDQAQIDALRRALHAVPKSGEVWCEGARLHLNPFVPIFDLESAARHLGFATRFTPQYGDSFLETLRLELLAGWIMPIAVPFVEEVERCIAEADSSCPMSREDISKLIGACTREAAQTVLRGQSGDNDVSTLDNRNEAHGSPSVIPVVAESDALNVDTSGLELRCSNADPNYGKLWFHCRTRPSDTARNVIRHAKAMVASDLARFAHIYVAAIVRRAGVVATLRKGVKTAATEDSKDTSEICDSCLVIEGSNEWEKLLEGSLRTIPSIYDMLEGNESSGCMVLLEGTVSGSDFITGLVEANQHKALKSLSLIERRKALFGSDLVLSWRPS